MNLGLNFNKKFIQAAKFQKHYSVASPQIQTNQKVEQHYVDEESIVRATYYLQGLLIKTEAFPYQPPQQQSPLQQNNDTRSPEKMSERKHRERREENKPKLMHASPRSPEELRDIKEDQDQRREQDLKRDKEIFKNTIKEETEKQKILI